MSVSEKLTAVAENVAKVYAAGEVKSDARHSLLYKTEFAAGNGGTEMVFDCPFEPDAFCLTSWSPLANDVISVHICVGDYRTFGKFGGMIKARVSSGDTYSRISAATLRNYYAYSDGSMKFTVPNTTLYEGVCFDTQLMYSFAAVKYTDKSDYELLSEDIALLNDVGGSVTYSQARVNATVTEEEWLALIATKPNWTFTLD